MDLVRFCLLLLWPISRQNNTRDTFNVPWGFRLKFTGVFQIVACTLNLQSENSNFGFRFSLHNFFLVGNAIYSAEQFLEIYILDGFTYYVIRVHTMKKGSNIT